jgi:hypothetical protein
MGNVVRLPRPACLRVVPSTGTRFGQILAEIDRIPGALTGSLDRVSGTDLAVVADRLDHCARRVRALAECCGTGGCS